MVVPAMGGEVQQITCGLQVWLPDRRKWDPLQQHLWTHSALDPSWSPDGTKIAWTALIPEKRHAQLWIVDVASGEHSVAWEGEPDYTAIPRKPNWSPDGRWIGFNIRTLPKNEIWALRNFLPEPAGRQPATDAVQAASFN